MVTADLLDAGLLSASRFVAGAVALVAITWVRRERVVVGRPHLWPALWLGVYAVCISYGYRYIGAAAGTFVFYATVLLTLMVYDVVTGASPPRRRVLGALLALAGIAVLTGSSVAGVTVLGVGLLAATGAAWGLYTAAGRGVADARVASTGNFVVLAAVLAPLAVASSAAGAHVTTTGLLWGVAMGAGPTALAYVAWYACQRRISGTTAGTVQLVIPLLTVLGAWALLGEQLAPGLVLAAALVAAGMWLARPARQASDR